MSARLAAGWARSRSQSVSVVPTSQWRPHGITNRTLFSVRRISPESDGMRSRGTTRCTPFEARTWMRPRPARSCTWSVHTPVALMTSPQRIVISEPSSRSRTITPATRSPTRRKSNTRALAKALAHRPDPQVLERAQPAVNELARAAGSAGREVALLDQCDLEPARGRVQRGAAADNPATDHDDVELLLAHAAQRVAPLL